MAHNAIDPIRLTGLTPQERVAIANHVGRSYPASLADSGDIVSFLVTTLDMKLPELVAFLSEVKAELYGNEPPLEARGW